MLSHNINRRTNISRKFPSLATIKLDSTWDAFFKNHEIVFHPSKGLLYLPDYTFTIPQKNSKTITKKYVLENVSRVSIAANQQEILECKLQKENRHLENAIGIIEPSTKFEQKTGLCLMSSISKVDNNLNTKVGVINLLPAK